MAESGMEYDLVVVGAGIYGVAMARTYLQVHPSAKLRVLEAGQTIGGTWSAERIYDGLCTNNVAGMIEYADYPMDLQEFGIVPGAHVPGSVMHKYLTSYAQQFGVWDRTTFGATVTSAELIEHDKWRLRYTSSTNAQEKAPLEYEIITSKLVMATGTTHEPNMPLIPGSADFRGHLFHFKEIPVRTQEMASAKNIVVLGGSKSAADAVWLNATKGKHVDWVIRESGRGPAWLSMIHVSPANLLFEKLALTRCMSFLSPCFNFDGYGLIRRFFHNTVIGRTLLKGFFSVIDKDLVARGRYNEHPETQKLLPTSNVFWFGTTVGAFNYPIDLFQLIRDGKVHVHRADISSLSSDAVKLANGTELPADVLICATGWKHKPTLSFLPEKIAASVGVSQVPVNSPTVQAADQEIFRRFPGLKDQPPAAALSNAKLDGNQILYLLYRGLVPPAFMASRNLAYCGQTIGIRGCLISHIQALWITAFLDGRLAAPLPSLKDAEWDALLQSRFYRWRAPHGLGMKCSDMVFETMPYLDNLLQDLGLETKRKGGWREIFEAYGVEDFRHVVDEWLAKS